MGHIFNRLRNFVKSEINNPDSLKNAEKTISSDDDDLRRIIEDLKDTKKQEEQRKESDSSDEMTSGKAYAILEIDQNASIPDIKAAYRTKLKEYHPDRVAHLGEELKELAAKKTIVINSAFEFIRNLKEF